MPAIERFTADRTQVALGDTVAFQWRARGIHVFFCRGSPADPPCAEVEREGSAAVYLDRRPETPDDTYHFAL